MRGQGSTIRVHEPTGKLLVRLRAGSARILSAKARCERGRWFVAFQTEVRRDLGRVSHPDVAIGIDLGVKVLAVTADSTGEVREIADPRHLDAALERLRHACRTVARRQGPDHRTGQQPSTRWEKADTARNRVHHRVANLRTDALHKLTTAIAHEYGTVVVEDLNVAGMLRNRRPRKIADAGFGEIRRQLAHKTRWNGCRLVVADRWFPSSKTCSECSAVKAKLSLHVRIYACDVCGLVLDRDADAARNLAALAARARLVPEWPETDTQGCRSLAEPTGRPALPARPSKARRGGQAAQPCRDSGRPKRGP